ncbi:MAG: Maf family protein [Acidiphilium sp.]
MTIVLASTSTTRYDMLLHAGVTIEKVVAPSVDESRTKVAAQGRNLDAASIALSLAELKALAVSTGEAGVVVIGADQILDCGGTLFDKPRDLVEAASHLRKLRGCTHRLETAVACARNGAIIWSHVEPALLTIRPLSEEFIAAYLAAEGTAACQSVGAYRLEGRGAQLFDRIEGDFFAILGLPLLPLLNFLRQIEALSS